MSRLMAFKDSIMLVEYYVLVSASDMIVPLDANVIELHYLMNF